MREQHQIPDVADDNTEGHFRAKAEGQTDSGRRDEFNLGAPLDGVCGDRGRTLGLIRCRQPVVAMEAGMATKITVTLEGDLDGGPADETVEFGLGGAAYEIDLSTKNAGAFRRQLAPYIEHARKAGPAPRRRPGRTVASRQRSGDIRAWARDQSIAVSARGRIPAIVVERYQAARRP